jgi:MFS family permease
MNTSTEPDQRPRHFIGWRIAVLATITGAMTGPGQTIGVSVFIDPMIAELNLTRSQVSLAYLIGTLVGAAALLPVGRWIDRVGSRRAMRWIGLAFGVGLVAMSGVRGFVTLAIGFTLIRWLGQGSLGLVSVVSITHWFERRRGAVFGLSFTAVSALMALTPIFLGLAIEAYNWRTAWLIAAVAVWLVVIPIARFGIVDRPADVGQYPDGDDAPTASSVRSRTAVSRSRREALGEVRFWLLNLAVAVTAMLVTALNFHQISILGEEGFTATEAATMFLPQVVGAIVAGLLVGALADLVRARYLVAMSMAILVCSLLLIGFIQPGWQVVLYAVMLGASAGAQRPLVATLLPRWYGAVHIGAIQGVSTLIGVAASAVGPVALALVSTWLGGYTEAAQLFAVIPIMIGLATLAISEPEFETRSATPQQ